MTEVNRKIHVIGINSYKFEDLSFKLQNLFLETENIAVPNSYFEEIKSWSENGLEKKKLFFSSNSNQELVNWLRSQKTDVILISRGDPLWFGIGRILLENFSKDELSFYPSNTCIQLAFSKLKIPWQDTVNVSIHGRDSTKLVEALKARPSSLAIITDSNNKSLEIIKKNLSELNLIDFYDFWLCEEIGLDKENIRKLNLKESLPSDISSLNIVVLTKTKKNFSNNIPLWYIFLSGFIGISAMILPGISGSFILVFLSKYEFILKALNSFDTAVISIFLAGCIVGLVTFSRVFSYLFKKYNDVVISVLIGFLGGSLFKIWPFYEVLEYNSSNEPIYTTPILPTASQSNDLVFFFTFGVIGFLGMWVIEKKFIGLNKEN